MEFARGGKKGLPRLRARCHGEPFDAHGRMREAALINLRDGSSIVERGAGFGEGPRALFA